ncbi:MAG: sulfite exporter TauE/SafE family protein [Nanoarchaeota archaeon]|nr:sulfite exporter TauE/SafE family protein [Nanoarchaeota archaeon]
MFYEILILLVAGLGVGLLTGLLSMSAVMFAAPLMIIFLDMSPYNAIGLSLAIDVFASITASIVFYENKNINLKKSLLLLFTAIVFVFVGSYISVFIPQSNLGWLMGFNILIVGIVTYKRKDKKINQIKKERKIYVFLAGMIIGLIAGIFGAGGGLMILFCLIFLLRYNIHEAIGTSVLIMVFIALIGSSSHYYYSPFNLKYLIIGAIGGIIGAYLSSVFANKTNEKKLKEIVGIILAILGLALIINNLLNM